MCAFWSLHDFLGGCKVYTSLGRMSLHPVFGGSRYRHHCCSMLIVRVTSRLQAGERGRKGSQVSYEGVALRLQTWSPTPSLGSGLQVFRSHRVCACLPSSAFYLVSSLDRPLYSWLTSSFYSPRGSMVGGSIEKEPL
jgi:hypothetical protein